MAHQFPFMPYHSLYFIPPIFSSATESSALAAATILGSCEATSLNKITIGVTNKKMKAKTIPANASRIGEP